jgi:eukaryotic-like serine/threonine-protein kinase
MDGRYSIIGKLAQGGMAEVYLANLRKSGDQQTFAVIKRVRPHLANDSDFVAMFTNEARLAAKINHTNVVSLFDIGQDGDNWMIAMEYLDGRDMLQLGRACRIHNKAVPFDVSARILADASAGLHHAHQLRGDDGELLNLVHRDMSPENILVTFDGSVKVVDFGIAKARDNTYRTQAGQIKGKLGYVAPEAIRGEVLDARADIFAIGATLYLFLCGRPAFTGKNPMEIFTKSLEPAAPPSKYNPRVPESLEEICVKCLAQDRNQRYQDCGELRDALEAHIAGTGRVLGSAQLSQFMRILFPPDVDPLRQKILIMMEEALARDKIAAAKDGRDAHHIDPEATVAGVSLSSLGLEPEMPSAQVPEAIVHHGVKDIPIVEEEEEEEEDKTVIGMQIPSFQDEPDHVIETARPASVELPSMDLDDASSPPIRSQSMGPAQTEANLLDDSISEIGDFLNHEAEGEAPLGNARIDSGFEDMDSTVVGEPGLPSLSGLEDLDLEISDTFGLSEPEEPPSLPPPPGRARATSSVTQPVAIDGFTASNEEINEGKSVEIDAAIFGNEHTIEGIPETSLTLGSIQESDILSVQETTNAGKASGFQKGATPPTLPRAIDMSEAAPAKTLDRFDNDLESHLSSLSVDTPSSIGSSISIDSELDSMVDNAFSTPAQPEAENPEGFGEHLVTDAVNSIPATEKANKLETETVQAQSTPPPVPPKQVDNETSLPPIPPPEPDLVSSPPPAIPPSVSVTSDDPPPIETTPPPPVAATPPPPIETTSPPPALASPPIEASPMANLESSPAPPAAKPKSNEASATTDSISLANDVPARRLKEPKRGKTEVIYRSPSVAVRMGLFLTGGFLGLASFAGIAFAFGNLPLFLSSHGINLPF